jgi:hypothetical protein
MCIGVVLAAVLGAACSYDDPSKGDDVSPMGDASVVDTCGGVPADGVCSGSELQRCVNGAVETESCNAGCSTTGGVATCNQLDCSTVGPLGRCDGDALARCDGSASLTDCAATGQACAYVDDTVGYGCVDPTSLAASRISGTVRWEDRALSPGELAPAVAMPARGTMVAILDDADTTLATVSTADDGSYVAYYAGTGNVRVVAYSRSRATARPARVRDAQGYLHALGSESFAAGEITPVDLLVTADSTIGGAWNALDNAVTAMDWLRARGITEVSPVFLYWQLGSATGSYYQGGDNSLHLDGDDGFDDVVALHELGHYVQDEYTVSDNPGGSHDGSPADPRLAWGEGGATWFAIAVRGVPYYIDYSAGGGWSVELEDRVHAANAGGSMSQSISEWMVAELMYDVGDAAGGDRDPVTATQPDVFSVQTGYMRAPAASRGVSGADLVEFLDGWFMQQGMATCTDMRSLVNDRYGFPYDFSGPAGACP